MTEGAGATSPWEMTAAEAARAIQDGTISVEALTRSCLERIAARDEAVKAWAFLDPDLAIRRARELDKILVSKGPLGPLHGLPVGVKDVIDTADMPTESNSRLHAGHRPAMDAECVRVIRASGALIMGKTDTVEFAAGGRKALTRHPMNPAHTPGGSSSGSGAAVGDRQVPLAFGTQTAGSLIRPASYNGIYALKPTHASVAWPGARQYAPTLDTIGWYGRSVEDLALVARAFRLRGADRLPTVALAGLKIGLTKTVNWERCERAAHDAMATAGSRLAKMGAVVSDLALPSVLDRAPRAQEVIMYGEGRAHFLGEYLTGGARLSSEFRERVEDERGIKGADLAAAYDIAAEGRRCFDALFGPDLDVVVTPSATGEAPVGLHSTGDYSMNTMWTVLHVPCIAIPVTAGPNGLPVGIQIVGPRFAEPRLLAIAAAMAPVLDPALA
jgi:Asp-tRNA(Asn)/Glu-tRNA(Gln) amidotransferase A subunit family amidase